MSPKPPRSVPRRDGEPPQAALRNHLIDVAERLLEVQPPAGLTAREIARAAGVSDGVLYNHFADKDEVVIAALLRRFEQLSIRFQASLPPAGVEPLHDSLEKIAKAALEFHSAGLPLVAGLISSPKLLRRFFDEIHGHGATMPAGVAGLARYFHDEQTRGRISAELEPMALVTTMFGAVLTVALAQHLTGAGHVPPERHLAAIVETLLRGALPRDDRG
jgi:AcrR family transcriptional regulator